MTVYLVHIQCLQYQYLLTLCTHESSAIHWSNLTLLGLPDLRRASQDLYGAFSWFPSPHLPDACNHVVQSVIRISKFSTVYTNGSMNSGAIKTAASTQGFQSYTVLLTDRSFDWTHKVMVHLDGTPLYCSTQLSSPAYLVHNTHKCWPQAWNSGWLLALWRSTPRKDKSIAIKIGWLQGLSTGVWCRFRVSPGIVDLACVIVKSEVFDNRSWAVGMWVCYNVAHYDVTAAEDALVTFQTILL